MENSDSKDLEQTAQTEEAAVEESADAQVVEEQPDADEKLAKELAQVKDQLLRTMAEYDNHRKRTAKEKMELRADIISNVVSDFRRSWIISRERSRLNALTITTKRAFR